LCNKNAYYFKKIPVFLVKAGIFIYLCKRNRNHDLLMKAKLIVLFILLGLATHSQAQTRLVFTPQWTAQAQFAGFYVADAKGFYKEAGLNVSIEHPSSSNPNINRLKMGQCQFITLHLVSAMKFIDEGIQLVNIFQHFQQNTQMIVSHKPLKGIESLRGMRIGHWKSGFSELAFSMNNRYNLNIQWVPFISHINLYISNAIDATMAMSYNEYFQLKIAGQKIQKDQTLYFRDIGYNVPEDGVYTTASFYKSHKQEVEKFAEATRKGWEWAYQNPEETLDIVMMYCQANNVATNRVVQEWMLQECLKVLSNKNTGKRTYTLDPKGLDLANQLMTEGGVIKKNIPYQQITQP
jgi:ABC-type nitrate/sulfonate/bicarbonate transport systems, periplasmic components